MLTEHSEDDCERIQNDRQDQEASALGQLECEQFIFDLLPAPLRLSGHSQHSPAHNTTLPAESVVCVLDAIWRGLPFAFGTFARQGELCACSTPVRHSAEPGGCVHMDCACRAITQALVYCGVPRGRTVSLTLRYTELYRRWPTAGDRRLTNQVPDLTEWLRDADNATKRALSDACDLRVVYDKGSDRPSISATLTDAVAAMLRTGLETGCWNVHSGGSARRLAQPCDRTIG
jgi:hypothetical protein